MRATPTRLCTSKGACCVPLVIWASIMGGFAQAGQAVSKWDSGLLAVELRSVHLRADSLTKAWQEQISGHLGIRSVLYFRDNEFTKFEFDAERCTVRDVLDVFCATYPGFTYTQDSSTGVIWLLPKAVAYESILSGKIRVSKGAMAVPMLSGVLDGLARINSLWLQPTDSSSTFALSTYDYPVDLPEGVDSARGIINACCAANPSMSFGLQCTGQEPGLVMVSPSVVGLWGDREAPPTAVAYWRSEVGGLIQGAPTENQVIEALANQDHRIRIAARSYVEMCWPVLSPEVLVNHAPMDEKGLWTAVGMLSVKVRTPGVTLLSALTKIRVVLSGESSASISPEVNALAAMELARVAGYTSDVAQKLRSINRTLPDSKTSQANDDAMALGRITKISLPDTATGEVKYDMIRVLRYSKRVRDKLLELKPQWAGFSKDDIEALGNTDIFSLP